ncbi:MAG: hypothetical protein KME30_27100 [Iphinoe sp. HA4291-MV1]|nr:hypothetical protein [Iphinoe sp. HA4291-MV1]
MKLGLEAIDVRLGDCNVKDDQNVDLLGGHFVEENPVTTIAQGLKEERKI